MVIFKDTGPPVFWSAGQGVGLWPTCSHLTSHQPKNSLNTKSIQDYISINVFYLILITMLTHSNHFLKRNSPLRTIKEFIKLLYVIFFFIKLKT